MENYNVIAQLTRASHLMSEQDPYGALAILIETEKSEIRDQSVMASLLLMRSSIHAEIGDTDASLKFAQLAREKYLSSGDLNGIGESLLRIGKIAFNRLDYAEAERDISGAVKLSRSVENGHMLLRSLVDLSQIVMERGDYKAAVSILAEAEEICVKIGDVWMAKFIRGEKTSADRRDRFQRSVERRFSEALPEILNAENSDRKIQALIGLANIRTMHGDLRGAEQALEGYLDLSKGSSIVVDIQEKHRYLLELATASIANQELWEARDHIREIISDVAIGSTSDGNLPLEGELQIAKIAIFEDQAHDEIPYLEALVEKANAAGDISILGEARYLLGVLYLRAGNPEAAVSMLEKMIQEEGVLDDSIRIRALHELGSAYRDLSRYTEALDAYEGMVSDARTVGDELAEVSAMLGIASVARAKGDQVRARRVLRRTLSISRRDGFLEKEAVSLHNLSFIDASEGKIKEAIRKLKSAIGISRDLDDKSHLAKSLSSLAHLEWEERRFIVARGYTQEALNIWIREGDIEEVAECWRDLSSASQAMGEQMVAVDEAIESLVLYQSVDDIKMEAVCFFQMGSIYRDGTWSISALEMMSIGVWLDTLAGSEFGELHIEHAMMLATGWGLIQEWRNLLDSAPRRYGDDRGFSAVRRSVERVTGRS